MRKNKINQGIINRTAVAVGVAALLSLAVGCAEKEGAQQGPALTQVGVVTVKASPVTLTRELPGRTSAFRVAEVRARVNGVVLKQMFTDGADVKEGQQLYLIDPAPYQATLDSARATLQRAEANLKLAQIQEKRQADLLREKVNSQSDYDTASASLGTALADVAAAKAAVTSAEINLEYTRVLSPITGRIGKSEVTEGAYVQAATATLLATVQQIDKLYVDVTQPASEVLRLQAELKSGRLQSTADGKAKVKLFYDDGQPYPVEGTLQFSDITVNPLTSSITMRAVFDNPKGDLLPGLFVREQLIEGVKADAILVPQTGVTRNSKGEATAMVAVEKDGATLVEMRILKLDRVIGTDWLVAEGLNAGDRVIVENLQRIRPGAKVGTYAYGEEKNSAEK